MKKHCFLGILMAAGVVVASSVMVTPNVYAAEKIGEAISIDEGGSFEGKSDDLESVSVHRGDGSAELPAAEAVDIDASVLDEINEPKAGFSTTGTGGFVYRMYKIVLGREPETDGYNYWVNKLNSHELAAADIVTGFFGSEEYQGFGKSNSAIVTDFYMAMLERTPEADGLTYWTNRLNVGMTGQAIAAGFVDSTEFKSLCARYGINNGTVTLSLARDQNYERTYFVYRLYKNCLERDPDIDGLEYWCGKIGEGYSGAEIAKGFLFSSEYKSWHTENEDFVNMLYKTILARDPETNGYNYWLNKLDYTTTRERVANGFLFSTEFSGQCTVAGINVGDPISEPDDSDEWQMNIKVLELCNNERAAQGLSRLKTKEWLWDEVAMVRTRELPRYFSHTRPDGRSCWTAYTDAGIYSGYSAENIAAGYTGAEAVVYGWMHSSGHRANILGSSGYLATGYVTSGSGSYGRYYSQNFMY